MGTKSAQYRQKQVERDYIHCTHSVGKRRALQLKVSCNSNLQVTLKIAVA